MAEMPERTQEAHPSKSARRRFRHRRNRGRYARLEEQNGVENVENRITRRTGRSLSSDFWSSLQAGTRVAPYDLIGCGVTHHRVQPREASINGNMTTEQVVLPETLFDVTEARQFLHERWIAVIEDLFNPNLDPADRPVVYVSPDDGSADEVVEGDLEGRAAADTAIGSILSQLNMK